MIGLQICVEFFLSGSHRLIKMALVDVANGDQPATLVADEMQVAHTDPARSDDAACHLIARSDTGLVPAHRPEHFTGQNCEQCDSRRRFLQKTPSGFTHDRYNLRKPFFNVEKQLNLIENIFL
jgi:hypothetical protein